METKELRAALVDLIAALGDAGPGLDLHRAAAAAKEASTRAQALVEHEGALAGKSREACMKLQTLRADRLEAEAEVRDARLEAAVLGLTQAHGGGEAEKQMRAQREALREARLGLDAAAATSVFASVALEPHTGGGPTEDGAAARRFHSQLLAAAALEPGGREVSVHAGWSAAAGHGAGAPAADVGGGEEGGAGARALAALEAMRGMGQDALARDVTLSRAGGAGRWRCVFSTRRRSVAVRITVEESASPDSPSLRFSSNVHLGPGCAAAARLWAAGGEAGEVVRAAVWAAIDAREEACEA